MRPRQGAAERADKLRHILVQGEKTEHARRNLRIDVRCGRHLVFGALEIFGHVVVVEMFDLEHIDGDTTAVATTCPLRVLQDKLAIRDQATSLIMKNLVGIILTILRASSYESISMFSYNALILFVLRHSSVSLNCLIPSGTINLLARRKRLKTALVKLTQRKGKKSH